MDRRRFLRKITVAAGAISCAPFGKALSAQEGMPPSMLITREETGETQSIVMTQDNALNNYLALCSLGRDVKRNEIRPLSMQLLDRWWRLYGILYRAVGFSGHFVIHSGYRSESTNREVGGVINSWHRRGGALDFHADGINMQALSEFVRDAQQGGVGYYPRRNDSRGWMHMDIGETRFWLG